MSLNSMLNQRGTLQQADLSYASSGEVIEQWITIQENVPCRITRQNPSPQNGSSGIAAARSAVGYLLASAAVGNPDRIAVRLLCDDLYWRITGVVRAEGPRETVLIADLALDSSSAS